MLELRDLVWTLPDGEEIIKGIQMQVEPGKLTVVTGPNGGGKTSIAKLTAGLSSPVAEVSGSTVRISHSSI